MKENNYLSENGLLRLLYHLNKIFVQNKKIQAIKSVISNSVLNIHNEYYDNLGFKTDQIVAENQSSSALGFGTLGVMTLGKSYDALLSELGLGQLGKIILKNS